MFTSTAAYCEQDLGKQKMNGEPAAEDKMEIVADAPQQQQQQEQNKAAEASKSTADTSDATEPTSANDVSAIAKNVELIQEYQTNLANNLTTLKNLSQQTQLLYWFPENDAQYATAVAASSTAK